MESERVIKRVVAGSHALLYREDSARQFVEIMKYKYQIPLHIGSEKLYFQIVSYVYKL